MAATFDSYVAMDRRLVESGFHPTPDWWLGQVERLLTHPTARTLVGRVGRGGAKSHVSVKLSLNEVLFGEWRVPPGERHLWAYVSRTKDEASQRLMLIERMLGALGVGYDRSGDEIALRDLPLGWRVFGATIGAVSGFRCIGYSADELAKWLTTDGMSNPAPEVCASLNSMTVTHPGARKFLISSTQSTLDYHYQRFELGDTADQIVAHAASWTANPDAITEEQAHANEPDPRTFLREYGAVPSAGVLAAFEGGLDAVIAKGTKERPYVADVEYVVAFDFGEDQSQTVVSVAHFEDRALNGTVARTLVVDRVEVLKPKVFGLRPPSFSTKVDALVRAVKDYKVKRSPRGDRHVHSALGGILAQKGIELAQKPMSMDLGSQARRSKAFVDRFNLPAIDIVDHPDVREQLGAAVLVARGEHYILTTLNKSKSPNDVLATLLLFCDAEFARVPASGGEGLRKAWVGHSPIACLRAGLAGVHLERGRWAYFRDYPNGRSEEVTPHRLAREFEEQRSARLRKGDSTQQDRDDLGEEELARRLFKG